MSFHLFRGLPLPDRSTALAWPALLGTDRDRLDPRVLTEFTFYLFSTLWPLVLIGVSEAAVALIAFRLSGDPLIAVFGVAGALAAFAHIGLILSYRALPDAPRRDSGVSAVWERRYGFCCMVFSACLGALLARIFAGVPEASPLAVALLYTYGAGLAARLAMRPRIATLSLILAVLPAMGGMALRHDFLDLSLLGFTLVFVLGVCESIAFIYKSMTAGVSLRYQYATLAAHDELTGLPNRLQTRERLAHEIARLSRHGGLIAVHYLDLNHFKAANDRHGHAIGDLVLQQVAERLLRAIRASDIVGRLGGDEFLIVQTGIAQKTEAEALAMRIIDTLRQPFVIEGAAISIGTSIGIALAPTDTSDISTLINYADLALYAAKGGADPSYAFHRPASDPDREAARRGVSSRDATAAL